MTVGQMIEALSNYNPEAQLQCGISIPALYVHTVANLSMTGDHQEADKCQLVRLVTTAPPLKPEIQNADPNPSGTVPGS